MQRYLVIWGKFFMKLFKQVVFMLFLTIFTTAAPTHTVIIWESSETDEHKEPSVKDLVAAVAICAIGYCICKAFVQGVEESTANFKQRLGEYVPGSEFTNKMCRLNQEWLFAQASINTEAIMPYEITEKYIEPFQKLAQELCDNLMRYGFGLPSQIWSA
jgi:hypothetical protein